MVAGPMQGSTYVRSGMGSPGSKDFYVDNLLRSRTLARPVPLSPTFLKARDESPKRTDLKFGVNTILALDSKDKLSPPRELHNPSK